MNGILSLFSPVMLFFVEIYRIISQRPIPDTIGATGNGGPTSTHVPIRLPTTNPVADPKQNGSCCP